MEVRTWFQVRLGHGEQRGNGSALELGDVDFLRVEAQGPLGVGLEVQLEQVLVRARPPGRLHSVWHRGRAFHETALTVAEVRYVHDRIATCALRRLLGELEQPEKVLCGCHTGQAIRLQEEVRLFCVGISEHLLGHNQTATGRAGLRAVNRVALRPKRHKR